MSRFHPAVRVLLSVGAAAVVMAALAWVAQPLLGVTPPDPAAEAAGVAYLRLLWIAAGACAAGWTWGATS